MKTTATIEARIEKELDRLDCYDHGNGLVCTADPDLPKGWVRVYDGTGDAYGPGDEILAALKSVEYDPNAVVRTEDRGGICYDRDCPDWHGATPEAGSPHAHGHSEKVEITAEQDNAGFESAWAALDFADEAPTSSQEWPEELIAFRQLENGSPNDNPNTLITVQTNSGRRYAAGPHGADYCALSDWLENVGPLATTRKEALRVGVES